MRPLLFTITHSTEDPPRAAAQVWSAHCAAAEGRRVALWLTHEGVRLAVQGVAETLREPYPRSVAEMIGDLVAGGAALFADRQAFQVRDFLPDALREGAELREPAALGALIDEGFQPVHV